MNFVMNFVRWEATSGCQKMMAHPQFHRHRQFTDAFAHAHCSIVGDVKAHSWTQQGVNEGHRRMDGADSSDKAGQKRSRLVESSFDPDPAECW